MRRGIVRIEGDRLANQLASQLRAADLEMGDTQEMECCGVVGLHRENLPVKRFGFRQPPGLVVLERESEGLLDCHHAPVFSSHHCRHIVR